MRLELPPETVATLHDGQKIRVRPIRPDDSERLREFHSRLSRNTLRLRFFTPLQKLSAEFAQHLCEVDFLRRCAFVVSFSGNDDIHGVGRYEAESAWSAEVAFVVEDHMQGMGMGVLLLERLVAHAREAGFERLTAVVMGENSSMLTLFRESPFSPEIHHQGSMAFVKMDIR